jgi:hypothetical protein
MGFSSPPANLPAAYLGVVANGTLLPGASNTTNKQYNCWIEHRAADAIAAISLVYANWYGAAGTGETGLGGSLTVSASVEYPIGSGNIVQMTFGGASSFAIADKAQAVSDLKQLGYTIPKGARFRTRTFTTSATGLLYSSQYDGSFARSEVPNPAVDKTMSGTVTAASAGVGVSAYGPIAILGMTSRVSTVIVGDSISAGFLDVLDDLSCGDRGSIARSISPAFGAANLAVGGEYFASLLGAGGVNRRSLLQYASHIICGYSVNDFRNGQTAAQVLASAAALIALGPTKKFFFTTCTPNTTSTDSWATEANQSLPAWEAQKITYNKAVRGVLPGASGFFDIAGAVESSLDSGKWGLSRGAVMTADGLHPTPAAYRNIRASGVINPALLTRLNF